MQMKPYLLGQGVSIFVDGSYSCPSSNVAAIDTITSMLNPYFISWKQHDQVTMHECFSFFFVTEILHLMVDRYTSHSIWKTLEKAFTSPSHTRIMIHGSFQDLCQGDDYVSTYLQKAKVLFYELDFCYAPCVYFCYAPCMFLFIVPLI
jgi:hypothetical protein